MRLAQSNVAEHGGQIAFFASSVDEAARRKGCSIKG